MIKNAIERYKRIRKTAILTRNYNGKYAFTGIGNHSINNLYPALNYLNINLKYIISNSENTANLINTNFENIKGTNDFNTVLNDPEIVGVFICANPEKHFSLIIEALKKDKNIFVEKPPCLNSKELKQLIEVEKNSKGFVLVGLQKRYAPLYQILKSRTKKAQTYSLKYETGYYPEGNSLTDLFIHPLDISTYLFGKANIVSIQHFSGGKGIDNYFLHIKHENNVIGNIELNTNSWWANASESLNITCKNAHYESKNTELLTEISKAGQIAGIPTEKIFKPNITSKILYQKNSFLPVMQHNDLYSAGYFNEIKYFLDLCENKKAKNLSSLNELTHTFNLLDSIKTKTNV